MLRTYILAMLGLALLTSTAHAAGDLNIVVILDNSGSMAERMPTGGTRIEAAKQALLRVLEQTPEGASVGVLLLNPGPSGPWLVPLGPVDQQATRAAVSGLRANGRTPLGGAMKTAADALLKVREGQRYGDYKLLVVSDGEATDGDLVERYLPQIQSRGLLVDVIGVAMPNRHSLATRASTYRKADDPASLEKAISAVVLGESSGGASDDAGESDFELLAPIPGEVATAVIAALTTAENAPIGSGSPRRNRSPPLQPSQSPPAPGPQHAGNAQGQAVPPPDDDGFSLSTLFIAGFILFVVLRVVSTIGKAR